jgi:hypothetical protein
VTAIEIMLKLSIIQGELEQIAEDVTVSGEIARAAAYAARALSLCKPSVAVLVARGKIVN